MKMPLSRASLLIFLLAVLTVSGCGAVEAKEVAGKAATHVYEQIDAGQLAQIYQESDPRLQAELPQEKFVSTFRFLDPATGPLGKRVKSEQKGFEVVAAQDGGQLVTLTYTSTWASAKTTDDRLGFVVNGSVAKLFRIGINEN
jgi:hypothetical protein